MIVFPMLYLLASTFKKDLCQLAIDAWAFSLSLFVFSLSLQDIHISSPPSYMFCKNKGLDYLEVLSCLRVMCQSLASLTLLQGGALVTGDFARASLLCSTALKWTVGFI